MADTAGLGFSVGHDYIAMFSTLIGPCALYMLNTV